MNTQASFSGVDIDRTHRGGRSGVYVAGSLQNRIRQFFLANPDEELTYSDLCVKFGCTLDQAHGAIRELMKRDGDRCALEAVHIIRGRAA